jgi:hypothetical protein
MVHPVRFQPSHAMCRCLIPQFNDRGEEILALEGTKIK